MLSKKGLHRIESLYCVRKQSTIIHRNEEDYVNVHNVVISKDCSILFYFFQQCIVCLYFVLKIAKTTNINYIRTLLHSLTAKKPNSRVNGSIKPL